MILKEEMRLRIPTLAAVLASVLAVLMLAGCDSGPTVNEQFRAKVDPLERIRQAGGSVPVALDALPDVLRRDLSQELQSAAEALRDRTDIAFDFTQVPDGRALALRVAFQPPDHLTALSLCQGASIGRSDSRRRSITVVAALCEDRRRLVAVRSVYTPSDQSDVRQEYREVLRAVVRRIFALPYGGA